MSVRLYVGNLPEEVTRQELEGVFAPASDVVSIKLITDRKTGKCRGFGFLTVATPEAADALIEQFNGVAFKETTLRVEKAQPKNKGDRSEEGGPEGEAGPADEAAVAAPAPVVSRPTPQISTGRSPIRKAGERNQRSEGRGRDARRERTAATSASNDDAFQPDPRWADALRDIKRLLTTKS